MIVKGIELMQMIADGKIKDRKIITRHCSTGDIVNYIFEDNEIKLLDAKKPSIFDVLGLITILTSDFEILEDKTDEIEEYHTKYSERCIDIEVRKKLNEIIRAVNKLNKQDTSKDENCMTE